MIIAITQWLTEQGMPANYLSLSKTLIGVVIIFFISWCSFYITHKQLLVGLKKWVIHSKNKWDDLILEHHFFNRAAWLVPYISILSLTPLLIESDSILHNTLLLIAKIGICIQVAQCLCALLNVVQSVYQQSAQERYLPLNSSIQVIKLVIYLIVAILSVSLLLDRSPVYLLSGLGALTAVLLLIFQDTIKGLVASIQISANKMVAPGDWISLPDYGADGDVLEIGLNTVKVQNFDRTITTVPTYALTSGAFKNWRDMFSSGGRRIKRALYIDVNSINFYSNENISTLNNISLLSPYLQQKQHEINSYNNDHSETINQKRLTNIGTFRAYITAYLQQHPLVHKNMTCMVRQLPASNTGIPLELYFFTNDTRWIEYENIQSDIFDHLYAITPHFGLRIFQHPSGLDWQRSAS